MSNKKKAVKIVKEGRIDPRQTVFLGNYLNPDSDTFGNAKASAILSGYTESYADNLMAKMPAWLESGKVGLKLPSILRKAENNLDEFLSEDYKADDKLKYQASVFALSNLSKHFKKGGEALQGKKRLINVELNIRTLIQGEKPKVEVIEGAAS